jgi:hypothetical protein
MTSFRTRSMRLVARMRGGANFCRGWAMDTKLLIKPMDNFKITTAADCNALQG